MFKDAPSAVAVRQWIADAGVNQAETARRAHLHPKVVTYLIRGSDGSDALYMGLRRNGAASVIEKVGRGLGVPEEEIERVVAEAKRWARSRRTEATRAAMLPIRTPLLR